jgi:hypothetical protein
VEARAEIITAAAHFDDTQPINLLRQTGLATGIAGRP